MPSDFQKEFHCPQCGSFRVGVFLYGLILPDEKLRGKIAAGEIILGGCSITPSKPQWRCRECAFEWGNIMNQVVWRNTSKDNDESF